MVHVRELSDAAVETVRHVLSDRGRCPIHIFRLIGQLSAPLNTKFEIDLYTIDLYLKRICFVSTFGVNKNSFQYKINIQRNVHELTKEPVADTLWAQSNIREKYSR